MGKSQRRKADLKTLHSGIDPGSSDPKPTAAMARILHALFETAKKDGNIDPPVKFLQVKVDATVNQLRSSPIACNKGCSHCCYTWVSVTAPEVLRVSRVVKKMGAPVSDNVRLAHEKTKDYEFDIRDQHPYPCPLLKDDVCSIYEDRPRACRLAASGDADICSRAYRNVSNENIPTPYLYLVGRTVYSVALAAALRKSKLPYYAYEYNAALNRAISTDSAEEAWLSGQDIFSSIKRETGDIFSDPQAQQMYDYAFRK